MGLPDLTALRRGESDAWDAAFEWLWPAVFAVAKLKLEPFCPDEIEDVAIESLESLVESIGQVKSVEEIKPLAASIAHHRAVSLLRERFAAKRGAGKTVSLDAVMDDCENQWEPADPAAPLANLERHELARLLHEIQAELKPEYRTLLGDFFLHGLSYEEIAAKRGVAVGTVGVYLKRGLEAMRHLETRHPQLLKELEAFLR